MPKTYRYKNLSFPVSDETEVLLTVSFTTGGTFGHTVADVPSINDPELPDGGTVSLGKGKDLRDDSTVIASVLGNLTPQIDSLGIKYEINGQTIQVHQNPKSEEEHPIVMLTIKFPK
ncbi:MAG: hypothetical protein HYV28_18055 [Ignavibacteriales bacterium]|nr:hypothetical protein [Ignavibacteriales bacterium]